MRLAWVKPIWPGTKLELAYQKGVASLQLQGRGLGMPETWMFLIHLLSRLSTCASRMAAKAEVFAV